MIEEIKSLLDLFESEVADRESNRLVWKFCNDRRKWPKAHGLFSTLRHRTLKAQKMGDKEKEAQYLFEEVVAKTLFNLTMLPAPFDPDSPYWIIANALYLAKILNISTEKVVEIVS
jgi:hypothetical protein